jgi:histone H3/H4
MAKANPATRVSKYFSLDRDQTTLDFVDVPIGKDTPVFLDPSRLRSMDTIWASDCNSLLQHFFERLLEHIRTDKEAAGLAMLEGLSERNEFHLGLSRGRSKGSGIGPKFAKEFWYALTKSKAGKTGLLRDLEDACLFIAGVGPDRISDAACNILRGPLIRYTQDMCLYYGIPLQAGVNSGPVWNAERSSWDDSLVELPTTPFGALLLVPKIAVRHRLVYDAQQYYAHYLLPHMQSHEKLIKSSLVNVLKDGRTRVTKKSLKTKYGADKLAIADQTLRHPDILDQYRDAAIRTSRPMTHEQFAEIENIDAPRFERLLRSVIETSSGRDAATEYENAIEQLLSALFFPSLSAPRKQHQIHDGRKRIDITYVNSAQSGFFQWLSSHYAAAHVFVECKNYGNELGNPEIDQLAGRFGPSRGQVGILVCRAVKDDDLLKKRCVDTAKDQRGYIIHLTDIDLAVLVKDYIDSSGTAEYPLLRKKFSALIM